MNYKKAKTIADAIIKQRCKNRPWIEDSLHQKWDKWMMDILTSPHYTKEILTKTKFKTVEQFLVNQIAGR